MEISPYEGKYEARNPNVETSRDVQKIQICQKEFIISIFEFRICDFYEVGYV